jgi:lipopolysaccharide transport system permease protein
VSLLSVNWAEFWRFRGPFSRLAWREVSARYKRSLLGIPWAVIQPVVISVVFTPTLQHEATTESGWNLP